MPIYEFECSCGMRFDRFLRLAEYNNDQTCRDCGGIARRLVSAPALLTDYEAYDCPVTGEWIEGRKAHRENLAKHGCRVYEPGETREFMEQKQKALVAEDKELDEDIERVMAQLPKGTKDRICKAVAEEMIIDLEQKSRS